MSWASRCGPGGATGATGDLRDGARILVLLREGESQYRIVDAAGDVSSGVDVMSGPVGLAFTVTGPDTCDVEFVDLQSQAVRKVRGRRLMGRAGAAITGFAVFNRDGERDDFYFNSLQVARPAR